MKKKLYQEVVSCDELSNFVDSFWMHENPSKQPEIITISASSHLKIVFFVQYEKIIYYILTGLWTEPKEIHIPPHTTGYGCRMKFLAAEYLLQREMATLINVILPMEDSFLNLDTFDLNNEFEFIKEQMEKELLKIKSSKSVRENKLRLSDLLYTVNGDISATEVSQQIFWTNRQINRYLNKYIGISLKKYLNLQKYRASFPSIVNGDFFPGEPYYDRPHFIREIKKYTGTTPKQIFAQKNDRFIQLKNISK